MWQKYRKLFISRRKMNEQKKMRNVSTEARYISVLIRVEENETAKSLVIVLGEFPLNQHINWKRLHANSLNFEIIDTEHRSRQTFNISMQFQIELQALRHCGIYYSLNRDGRNWESKIRSKACEIDKSHLSVSEAELSPSADWKQLNIWQYDENYTKEKWMMEICI